MPPVDPARPPGVDVIVCRGCCCGSATKRPGTDHAGQLAALGAAVESLPDAKLLVTECLGPCEVANVVVVRSRGRLPGEPRTGPLWFGNLTDPADTAELCDWVRRLGRRPSGAGAAAGAALPAALESLRIPAHGPGRRTRAAPAQ
ncbi:hypothetical protein GCM10009665_53540 [Kitasatospora nipponensis]|uniref:(2Fe-2S) ferredoxin n=1 Tax=Kitasatospora nipponensis TaxID=258049 RepID=A0ABP4HAS4_9ACTN